MNYTVIWIQDALDRLMRVFATLWGSEAGREVTEAMAREDAALETDPEHAGESRAGVARVTFEPPLTVLFEVHPGPRVVVVTNLVYNRPRSVP